MLLQKLWAVLFCPSAICILWPVVAACRLFNLVYFLAVVSAPEKILGMIALVAVVFQPFAHYILLP